MTKPFSWSWSRLKNWRACPKRHYEIDLSRNFREEETDALRWGNQVHQAFATRIERGMALPETMKRFDWWPSRMVMLREMGVEVSVENKMAINQDMQATGYFEDRTWFRCVIDVKALIPASRAAITIDWKTGANVNPEFEQLGLSAQVIFAHHPEIDQVGTIYVWIGHDTQTIKIYRRGDMSDVWNRVLPDVSMMESAHRLMNYPPKPSGLCKRHCPVKSCPHWGRGSF